MLSEKEIYYELYECWLKRIKSKRFTLDAYNFERNIGAYLYKLAEEIISGTWQPNGYRDFLVFHPTRTISAPMYADRVVEQWLTEKYIIPNIEDSLHPMNVACRKDKGPIVAVEYLKDLLKSLYETYGYSFYILTCDMEGYYDNISHERVLSDFSSFMEKLPFVLFKNIVDGWQKDDCYAKEAFPDKVFGVPKEEVTKEQRTSAIKLIG